jgi:hypothetical protein
MQSHPESVQDEIGAHMPSELPADDHPAVGVDHEAEEHQPLPAPEIREVREPLLVRPGRREVAVDPVWAAQSRRARLCGPPRLPAALCALNAVLAHQAFHPAAADLLALAQKRLPHPPRPVGAVVRGVQLFDHAAQPLILDGPR